MKTIKEAVEQGEWEIYLLTDTGEKIYPSDSHYELENDNFIYQTEPKYKLYLLVAARKKALIA